MDIDKEILISKVFLNSVIWDKRLEGHANRKMVDKAWQSIAAEMGSENDGVLRKKWKYLRDQFAVEVGKFPPPRSGDSGDRPESKWPYFKSLRFLLGIVKARTSASNLKKPENENEDLVSHYVSKETDSQQDVQEIDNQVSDDQRQQAQMNSPSSDVFSGKRKRNNANKKYNQEMLDLETKKASLLERVINDRGSDDDDALFFRSLLPHVSKIPQHLKLRFRSRVQMIVDEFAYASHGTMQSSHSNSQSAPSFVQQYSAEYILSPDAESSTSGPSSVPSSCTDEPYISKWFAYQHFEFLKNRDVTSNTTLDIAPTRECEEATEDNNPQLTDQATDIDNPIGGVPSQYPPPASQVVPSPMNTARDDSFESSPAKRGLKRKRIGPKDDTQEMSSLDVKSPEVKIEIDEQMSSDVSCSDISESIVKTEPGLQTKPLPDLAASYHTK
ncbi:uncharacterized protein LOC123682436 isoform X3 [Harmonia axyridis]|uniref:uncharacterized protein LOC123682436 isoform X3 n=1 Tax=Harmonia axyridis TaxID=115357 RepID=UPI001E2765CC|nr:uncharacterized protein LOC123682436 isoform X3 [Harmonia axyridis]